MNKKVIAVIGMAGSGKSEAINYLVEKHHWPKVYFGEITFDEMKRLGLELNYENERTTREGLRKEYGMGAYAIKSLPKIKKALETSEVVLVESLYSWDEYKILKEEFGDDFKCIAVYASPETRFHRMKERKNWRPVSGREELKKRDWTEIEGTDKGGPIAMADHTIINEGAMQKMYMTIDEIIKKEKV